MNTVSASPSIRTRITLSIYNHRGDLVRKSIARNKLIHGGAEMFARLTWDPGALRPSHLVARFAESLGAANENTNLIEAEAQFSATINDFLKDGTGTRGAIRAASAGAPLIRDNGVVSNGSVTLPFRLSEADTVAGTYVPGTSKIYYLGLAAAASGAEPEKDLLTTVVAVDALDIPGGGQLGVDYELKFNAR